jgi:hypothetical protein
VLGIISQAFSGAANGLAGQPGAPTPLDRIIAEDLQTQLANMGQANQNVSNQRSLLKDMYDSLGNMQAAKAAVYQTGLLAADARAKAYANNLAKTDQSAIQKYEIFHAQIMDKYAQSQQALTMQLAGMHQQSIFAQAGFEDRFSDIVGGMFAAHGKKGEVGLKMFPGSAALDAGVLKDLKNTATNGTEAVQLLDQLHSISEGAKTKDGKSIQDGFWDRNVKSKQALIDLGISLQAMKNYRRFSEAENEAFQYIAGGGSINRNINDKVFRSGLKQLRERVIDYVEREATAWDGVSSTFRKDIDGSK